LLYVRYLTNATQNSAKLSSRRLQDT